MSPRIRVEKFGRIHVGGLSNRVSRHILGVRNPFLWERIGDIAGPMRTKTLFGRFSFSFSYQMGRRGQGITRAWQALSLDGVNTSMRQPRPRQAKREKREKSL